MDIWPKKQEELVLKNRRLVYYLVNKLGVPPSDYDDIVSIGTIGLIKAARTFNESKGTKFATYASRCIENEIFMHYRKERIHANDISLDAPIKNMEGEDGSTLGDIIPDSMEDFTEKIAASETFTKFISIILNLLEPREKVIMLYKIAGIQQRVIAKALNISQSYISRLEKRIVDKVKLHFTDTQQFKEVFSMAIVDDLYRISFSSKDIKHFNEIFATLLQKLTSAETLPNFKVSCNKERIIIQIPAYPESFSFLAQIIQEINDFSLTFVSNKDISTTALPKEVSDKTVESTDMVEEMESSVTEVEYDISTIVTEIDETVATIERAIVEEAKIVPIVEDTTNTDVDERAKETVIADNNWINKNLNEVDSSLATDTNSTVKKGSKIKQVRDYMLSMSSFTVKELKQHFSTLSIGTITNALNEAKEKGLITLVKRGEYRVNNMQK